MIYLKRKTYHDQVELNLGSQCKKLIKNQSFVSKKQGRKQGSKAQPFLWADCRSKTFISCMFTQRGKEEYYVLGVQ